jgi:hypothetical protein
MSTFRILLRIFVAAAGLSAIAATPLRAQQVISEPGYCAQFYPSANCQNKGAGNPYTDPNYRAFGNPNTGYQVQNVAPRRWRTYRSDYAGTRMQ